MGPATFQSWRRVHQSPRAGPGSRPQEAFLPWGGRLIWQSSFLKERERTPDRTNYASCRRSLRSIDREVATLRVSPGPASRPGPGCGLTEGSRLLAPEVTPRVEPQPHSEHLQGLPPRTQLLPSLQVAVLLSDPPASPWTRRGLARGFWSAFQQKAACVLRTQPRGVRCALACTVGFPF